MNYTHEPIVLSIEDAAEYFNLSPQFIRGRVWNKEIPYIMSGKKYYISVKGFTKFLEDACNSFTQFDCGCREGKQK